MSRGNISRAIGVIGKPFGIDGYVFVNLFTDYPNTIEKNNTLYLDENCSKKIVIQDIKNLIYKKIKKRIIFKFYNFNTKQSVEQIKGSILFRHYLDQPNLKEDTFWVDDLVDSNILQNNEMLYGKVIKVESLYSNDYLVVKTLKGKIENIPFIEDYIDRVLIEKKIIILKKIPEYF